MAASNWEASFGLDRRQSTRIVNEAERALRRFLDGDHEAHSIRPPTREGSTRVLQRDRVHVAAAFVRSHFNDPPLDRGHPVWVAHVRDWDGPPTPPAPIGGIPLPDAEPSSTRVRDHRPPRPGLRPGRPVREREHLPLRLWPLRLSPSWRSI
jgi:hypothetical protein